GKDERRAVLLSSSSAFCLFTFALLFSVGLRRGGLFRLAIGDVEARERLLHVVLDAAHEFGVLSQGVLRVLAALAEPLTIVRKPRARLLDDAVRHRKVEHVALARDALAVHDVELALAEWGRDLVLDDLDLRAVADHAVAVLDRADAAYVEAHGGVELEGPPAGRRLRASEHDADLLTNLVDEDEAGVRLPDDGR